MAHTEERIRRQQTVLVVEDDPGLTLLLTDLIREMGYKAIHTSDGKSAYTWLTGSQPFFILLDYSLPDMTCLELIEWVERSTHKDMPPFVVITGAGNEQISVDLMKRGALDYLIKDPMLFSNLPKTLVNVRQRIETQQKLIEMETSLRESEKRYRELIENQGEGIGIVDLNDVFIFANPAAEELFGVKSGALVGRNVKEFIDKSSLQLLEAESSQRLEGKKSTYEIRIHRKDDSTRDILITATPRQNELGAIIGTFGIFRDITEQKQVEEALQVSEEHFRKIFKTIPDFVSISRLRDGTFVEVNDRTLESTGYSKEEILQHSSLSLNIWDTAGSRDHFISQLLEKNILHNYEISLRIKDGSLHPCLISAQVLYIENEPHILAVIRDITEIKQVEQAIRDSEIRYRIVADNTYDWEYWLNTEGEFAYVSPSCLRISGYTAEEFLANSDLYVNIIHPNDQKIICDHHTRVLKSRCAETRDIEFRIIHKDGSERWIGHVCQPVYDLEGKFIGVRGSNRDITEHRTAQVALIESKEKYRSLFDSMLEGCVYCQMIYDEKGTPDDWIFLDINSAFERLTGLKNIIGKRASEVLPGIKDRQAKLLESYGRVAQSGRPEIFELNLTQSAQWLNVTVVSPDKGRIIAIFEDITERKRTEHELQRWAHIFENAEWGIAVCDPHKRTLDFVNPAFAGIHGYREDELSGFPILELSAPEYREQVVEQMHIAVETGHYMFESENVRKDGTRFPALIDLSSVRDSQGVIQYQVASIYDITELRMYQNALRNSEQRLRFALEGTNDGIWDVQMKTGTLYLSPRGCEILGYDFDEFAETVESWDQLVHPDDLPLTNECLNDHLQGRAPIFQVEQRLRSKSGDWKWILTRGKVVERDEQGNALRLTGTHTDIENRKKMEAVQNVIYQILEASSQSERLEDFLASFHALLNELVDATNFYVALYNSDMDAYSFPYFVDEFDQIESGYRQVPKSLTDYVRKTGMPLLADEKKMKHLVESGDVEIGGTLCKSWLGVPMKTSRGTIGVMTVQSYKNQQRYKPEDVNFMMMVASQVSMAIERKINQDALKTSEDRLRMAQRMEAIGRLAGGVSHDFNNLLTAITGHSEIILSQISDNDPIRPDLEEILKTAHRAGNLTRQLLTFSRRQTVTPVVFNLDDSVSNMQRMLKRIIGENIRLETSCQSDDWNIKADPGQIEQVIVNLAVNARDAMPKGGNLTIETIKATIDEEFSFVHPEISIGNYIMLAVSDTGTGMSPEIQSRIFEPFFTTKAVGEGTGLGLATVYGIVKQSGGYIVVQSTEGSGSTFSIYLPAVLDQIEKKALIPDKSLKLQGREYVLLVEDSDSVRNMFARVLGSYGYHTTAVSNAEEALRICSEMTRPPDILVSDVILPGMNGRELALKIQAIYPSIRIILMSGYTAEAIPEEELEAGLKLLQKPFGPVYLISKIRDELENVKD